MITFTDAVIVKLSDLIAEAGNPNLKLRVFVQGGGCAGFSYGFAFEETIAPDDTVLSRGGVTVLIDSMSYQYLVGSTLDYKEELMGSSFVINNPSVSSTCGCGSSFSLKTDLGGDFEDFGHGF